MKIYLITILLMLSCNVFAYDPSICFPGKAHELYSPSGAHQFVWKEPKDQDDEHHLFYGLKGTDSQELLTFVSSVCMHWSPDEKYFSISNRIGSNVMEAYIFRSDDTSQRIDVIDLLPSRITKYFGKGISHGYLEALSWDKHGLTIRAFGDREDAPRNFDVTLKCTMNKDKWTCRKTAANKSMQRIGHKAASR